MLLAIDCGNTNTVFSVYDGAVWRVRWRARTETGRTADEHAVWLGQLFELEGLSFSDLRHCIISTVVPQALFHLRNLARRYVKTEPLVVGEEGVESGIEVRLPHPEELGSDRLVNAAGARACFQTPLLIIDSGTATTFDIISEDGAFVGGVIAPGLSISMSALHQAAAKLPRIAIERPDNVIGLDTETAMQSGVFWGYVSLIEGLIERLKQEYGVPMTVIGTGGVSSLFQGVIPTIDHFDPDLTMHGLLDIWRRNKGECF